MRIVQIAAIIFLPLLSIAQGGVGINTDGSTPDPSAMLDVKADSAGILIPRTDTSSIVSPVNGLLIFDSTIMSFFYYKVDRWVKLVESTSMRYYYRDQDGDGYGDKFWAIYAPDQLPGYVPDSTDCNDLDPAVYTSEPEICDGFDNDCNPATPDGAGDPSYQTPCDGPDADLCEEGTWECIGGAFVCTDNTSDSEELCDGIDNDCDPSTSDGAHEPSIGMPCDGPDSDLCEEGFRECVNGILVCSDNTGNNIEVCDGIDNDCDGQTDEGSLCPPYNACIDGECASCCTNNGGSSCASSVSLGPICGDQGSDQLIQNGCGEAWFRFILEECNTGVSLVDLQVTILLQNVPAGMDYDLHLYADNCTTILASSTLDGSSSETIQYMISDSFGTDNTTPLRVRVVLWSGNGSCGQWTLTINGNQ